MSGLALPDTRIRLDQIRARLASVKADRWSHEFNADGERIVLTRAVFDGTGKRAGDEAPVDFLSFGADAAWHEKEFIREVRDDLEFVLELLSKAGRIIRDQRALLRRLGWDDGPKADAPRLVNLAAEASMKCSEAAFQKYLAERHAKGDDGDMRDTAAAAAVLRRVLGVGSRKELNTDPDAAQRWRDMRADFQAWGRGDEA